MEFEETTAPSVYNRVGIQTKSTSFQVHTDSVELKALLNAGVIETALDRRQRRLLMPVCRRSILKIFFFIRLFIHFRPVPV